MAPSRKSQFLDLLKDIQATATADANTTGDDAAVTHAKLLQQIHQLQQAAETPVEKMARIRFQHLQNLSLRIALEYGFLQSISERGGADITAAELGEEAGVDRTLVIRIMRLVVYIGYCEQPSHATYAANDVTPLIVQRGYIGGEKHINDIGFPIGGKIVELVRSHGLHQFPDRASGQKSPFEYTFGTSLLQYFTENEEQKQAFDDYMTVRRDANAPQWFEIYPAAERLRGVALKSDEGAALVVDVGGGKGHEVARFHERFPELPGRLVLQELPETIRLIGNKPVGVEVMEHDFFNEQPVQGARFYFFRSVLHARSDTECKKILTRTVNAMDKDYSRILIDEFVLPNEGVDLASASMDIQVMLYVSGIERDEHHWQDLLGSVGLQIVKVWYPKVGRESVIEARIR